MHILCILLASVLISSCASYPVSEGNLIKLNESKTFSFSGMQLKKSYKGIFKNENNVDTFYFTDGRENEKGCYAYVSQRTAGFVDADKTLYADAAYFCSNMFIVTAYNINSSLIVTGFSKITQENYLTFVCYYNPLVISDISSRVKETVSSISISEK